MTWIGAQVPVDDEVYLYYGGYAKGHKVDGWTGGRQIGLARIRKDGYVSLRAEKETGVLITPHFTFEGDRLELNLATEANGIVRVEVQDNDGTAIEGFSLTTSESYTHSKLNNSAARSVNCSKILRASCTPRPDCPCQVTVAPA